MAAFSFPGTGTTGWYMVDGQTRPFGRWEYQTTITNAHQLQLMTTNLGASYTLAGDIDLGASLSAVGGKYPGMWSSAGFVPIGNLSTKFTGSFDGQGGTISGLLINRPTTNYVGLFGYVGIGGTVHHVGLQNATVTGQNDTGALAGYNSGAITQAYAAGTVSGAGLVGGLVGVNGGTITQTYATAAVSGTGNYVGGLAGYNSNAITQSYAAGTVSGLSFVGGLAGNNPGTITQSYWDVTTSGNAAGVGTGNATGITELTTSQMQDPVNYATTYAGWDFANVWSAPSVGYYPQLYGVNYVLRVDPTNVARVYGDTNPVSPIHTTACTPATHQPFSPACRCRRRRRRRPMSAATRSQRAAASSAPPGRPIA